MQFFLACSLLHRHSKSARGTTFGQRSLGLVFLVRLIHGGVEKDNLVYLVTVDIVEEGTASPFACGCDDLDVASADCQMRGMACAKGFPSDSFGVCD